MDPSPLHHAQKQLDDLIRVMQHETADDSTLYIRSQCTITSLRGLIVKLENLVDDLASAQAEFLATSKAAFVERVNKRVAVEEEDLPATQSTDSLQLFIAECKSCKTSDEFSVSITCVQGKYEVAMCNRSTVRVTVLDLETAREYKRAVEIALNKPEVLPELHQRFVNTCLRYKNEPHSIHITPYNDRYVVEMVLRDSNKDTPACIYVLGLNEAERVKRAAMEAMRE